MKFIYLIFAGNILVTISSCGQLNNTIKIKGFEDTEKNIEVIFPLGPDSLIIGGRYSNFDSEINHPLLNGSAYIMTRSSKGEWIENNIGEGVISQIECVNGSLLLVKTLKSDIYRSQIITFDEKTAKWEVLAKFPFRVSSLYLFNNSLAYLTGSTNSNDWVIMESVDSCINWKEVSSDKMPEYKKIFSYGGGVLVFMYSENRLQVRAKSKDSSFSKEASLLSSKPFFVTSATKIDNKIYLSGHFKDEAHSYLYSYDIQKNQLSIIGIIAKDYIPLNLYSYENVMYIILEKVYGFSTSRKVLRSFDRGATWKEVEGDLGIYFEPYTFNRNLLYGYIGVGRIRMINLLNSDSTK